MADDDLNAGEINEKDRQSKRLRKLGTTAEILDDRLGSLPSELFTAVTDKIYDVETLENLSLTSKLYHKILGNTVKEVMQRKYTREDSAAIYDSVMRDGIPTAIHEDTIPELALDDVQPHAATAAMFGDTLGPIVRYLDDHRQDHFATQIVAAPPNSREEVVRTMVDHMCSFRPEFRKKIFDAVIDDFENEQQPFNVAGALEDATLRKNLTLQQLHRVSDIRVANPEAQEAYRNNIASNDGSRFELLRRHQDSNSRSQLTDSGAPYGLQFTSDALNYTADRADRLKQLAVVSRTLANDAMTARGDLMAAREIGARNERGR